MIVDEVSASVREGGRIFTRPQDALDARVVRGGVVRYWGSPSVTSSAVDGGIVSQGAAADADKPLSQLGPRTPAIAPIPPVPPVPPIPATPPSRRRGII
jgi:hypothetical protein